jgi:hypothetical protein
MRGKTPTIHEIKAAVEAGKSDNYLFTRDSMKFFGQTLRDFKVKRSPTGRIFIYARSYWKDDHGGRRLMGYTFREYLDGQLLNLRAETGDVAKTESGILEYIAAH